MCSHLFLSVFVSDKAEVSLENFNVLNVQLVLKFPVLKRKMSRIHYNVYVVDVHIKHFDLKWFSMRLEYCGMALHGFRPK